MAIFTITDPYTFENVNYYEITFSEINGPIDNVIYKKIFDTDINDYVYYKRAFTGSLNVKWFGAVGDGVANDTLPIKTALNTLNYFRDGSPKSFSSVLEFETGVYLIDSTLTIAANISLKGQGSPKKAKSGGELINSSTIIRWIGNENNTMLFIENVIGITIQGICFDTRAKSGSIDQDEMEIKGITAIKYLNRVITRYNEISNCSFYLLDVGVHYSFDNFDNDPNDGIIDGDSNMDTNYIDRCLFQYCVIGIKVEQTNVYNALISRCAFYGSYAYTKHHMLIVKGHAEISDSYLGVLKDGSSVGGKNGIAVEVNQGYCNLNNIYAETHNGPFFVWKSALYEGMTDENGNPLQIENCTSNLVSCNVAPQTNTLPTNYIVENRTLKTLNVVGGEFTYWFSQKIGTSGAISIVGTNNANVSSTSEPGRVFFFGNKYTVPVAGSIADILNKGTGKLHVAGENAELHLTQIPSFKSVVLNWQGNILSLAVPGYYPEIKFDFGNKILKLPGWTVDNSL